MGSRSVPKPIITGIGISDVGRRTGTAGIELTLQAVTAALADAGLAAADIDAVTTLGDVTAAHTVAAMGIAPTILDGVTADTGLLSPLTQAVGAIMAGDARHVLVYRTVEMLGGSIGGEGDLNQLPAEMAYLIASHAYSAANWIAMMCRAHMDRYGTTKEQLGWVAITARDYASRNPRAAYRTPITMDDYLAARTVSSPFGLLDCDVPVDGSVALVLSIADYARDCPQRAVTIEALGGSSGSGGWTQRCDYPQMAATDAAAAMWSRTDLRPADVDIAELYDGFSFLTIAWLEALGFCASGEGGPFVEGGRRLAADGTLPVNTYGGQLSAGRLHGYWLLHEACQQLRGDDDAWTRKRPEVAVASAGGGPIAGCVLLTC